MDLRDPALTLVAICFLAFCFYGLLYNGVMKTLRSLYDRVGETNDRLDSIEDILIKGFGVDARSKREIWDEDFAYRLAQRRKENPNG